MPVFTSIAAALLPLIAQVGPFTAPGTMGTPLPQPVERPARARALRSPGSRAAAVPAPSHRLQDCLAAGEADAASGLTAAEGWLAASQGREAAEAGLCVGTARSRMGDWAGAEQAFLAAGEHAQSDRLLRVRLDAMAGNAALAAGAPARALTALDQAAVAATGLAEPSVTAPLQLDRARALVALDRPAEAASALAAARVANPADAEAWLLSATLSRRQGQLAAAQQQIEQAATLNPVDPAIGLEAGVIAMLAGRPEAARKAWAAVVALAPDEAAGQTARSYLAQVGSAAPPPR